MRSARNLVENLWEVHILSRSLDLFEHLSADISLKRQIYFTTPFIILYGFVGNSDSESYWLVFLQK